MEIVCSPCYLLYKSDDLGGIGARRSYSMFGFWKDTAARYQSDHICEFPDIADLHHDHHNVYSYNYYLL